MAIQRQRRSHPRALDRASMAQGAALLAGLLATGVFTAVPAAATTFSVSGPVVGSVSVSGPVATTVSVSGPVAGSAAVTEQQAADSSVAAAAANGIRQSVAVVDRATGNTVASSGGGQQYIAESIVKLFTVAYYEVQADGNADPSMTERLRTMIIESDDDIESELWNVGIVPAMATRYGLGDTGNGPRTSPDDWGWELITADDEAQFLYRASLDPLVAPLLLDAMANVAPTGADGFDQDFGLNALPGDHGSKQGWTDVGSAQAVQLHSVGWTDRYFVAILQSSPMPNYEALRTQSTAAAQSVVAAEDAEAAPDPGASGRAAPTPQIQPPTESPPTPSAPNQPTATTSPLAFGDWLSREISWAVRGLNDLINSW